MTDCTATALIHLGGHPCRVICNLPAHPGPDHEDLVLGPWSEPPTAES